MVSSIRNIGSGSTPKPLFVEPLPIFRMEETIQKQLISSPDSSSGAPNTSVAGDLRLHELQSRVFRNTRMLRVWLPPGYEDPENKGLQYPVFYLNDGQNLFDRATAFIGV